VRPWLPSPGWIGRGLGRLLTFAAIVMTWVWFRAADVESAWQSTVQMLAVHRWWNADWALSGAQQLALWSIALLVLGQWWCQRRTLPELLGRLPAPLLGVLLGLLAALIVLSPGESHAFIYFQF